MIDLTVQRLRAIDLRAAPLGVWILIGLAVVDVVVRVATIDKFFPPPLTGLVLVVAPLLVAAAVLLAQPANRGVLVGALALAAGELLRLVSVLVAPERIGASLLADASPVISEIGSVVGLVGVLLIGIGLGGLRSRLALAALAVGGVFYLVEEIWYIQQLLDPSADLLHALPLDAVVVGFIGPLITVAWAFVAGASYERGMRWFPLGAGLIVSLAALDTVLTLVSRASPETDFGFLLVLGTAISLAAWACLIVGALTELGPPVQNAEVAESAAGEIASASDGAAAASEETDPDWI